MNNEIIQSCLTNVITVILSIFSTQYFFDSFFERKRLNRWLCASGYILVSLAFFSSLQLIENRSLNMVILLGCTYLLSLFFTMKWYNRLLFTLLFITVSAICELAIALIMVSLLRIEFGNLQDDNFRLTGMLLSKFVSFALFALLRIKKHHFLSGKRKQSWNILFFLPSTTILVLLVLFKCIEFIPSNNSLKSFILVSIICLIICNFYIFRFIDTLWQSTEIEQKLAIAANLLVEQERQYTIVVSNHQEITKMHHDYKNALLGIHSELIAHQYDEAIQHIQSKLSLASLSNSDISGNHTIDTIVNTKMSNAKRNGISIDFQFRNIQELLIDSIDLSVLLGNALDNAIEATCKVSDLTRKQITLLIVLKDSILNIVIKNPVEKPVDANHLVSSKIESRYHGYGIINMRTIVNRYEGSLLIYCF